MAKTLKIAPLTKLGMLSLLRPLLDDALAPSALPWGLGLLSVIQEAVLRKKEKSDY
jgi:hypothetical protein